MMKNFKILLFTSLVATTFACNDTSKNHDEAVEAEKVGATAIVKADAVAIHEVLPTQDEQHTEVSISYTDSIDFEKYEVGPQKRVTNAPIDWDSYPDAKMFKTRISEAYKTNDVNFGGFYITSAFGCGASCLMGFMVDVRDGKIYDLPLGEENSCFYVEDRALYNWMSRIFIAGVCKNNIEDTKVYYRAYLWNEDKKEFEKIEAENFLKK